MFGIELVLTLMLIRLMLPLGLILWIGALVKQRETQYWFRLTTR